MMEFSTLFNSGGMVLAAFLTSIILLGATLLFLRSGLLFIAQLAILVLLVLMGGNVGISLAISVVQLLFVVYFLYRMKKAIDYNYQLVLEKTHHIPPQITRNGYHGGRVTF